MVHQPIIIHGASRTDSGVHARGQVAAFVTIDDDARGRGGWPIERGTTTLMRAVNPRLPADVLVTGAEVVDESFNPINGAVSKGYSYTIWKLAGANAVGSADKPARVADAGCREDAGSRGGDCRRARFCGVCRRGAWEGDDGADGAWVRGAVAQ